MTRPVGDNSPPGRYTDRSIGSGRDHATPQPARRGKVRRAATQRDVAQWMGNQVVRGPRSVSRCLPFREEDTVPHIVPTITPITDAPCALAAAAQPWHWSQVVGFRKSRRLRGALSLVLHEAPKRVQHPANGRDLLAVSVLGRRHGVEVPEQLVGAVDEMDLHGNQRVGSSVTLAAGTNARIRNGCRRRTCTWATPTPD